VRFLSSKPFVERLAPRAAQTHCLFVEDNVEDTVEDNVEDTVVVYVLYRYLSETSVIARGTTGQPVFYVFLVPGPRRIYRATVKYGIGKKPPEDKRRTTRIWLTALTSSIGITTMSSSTIPTVMKCVFYGDLEKVQDGIPVPKLTSGHLLVRVKAVSLNPVDAKNVVGDKLPHSWSTGHAMVRWFIQKKIPGFDFAGVCVASTTNEYKPGDKVYGTMPPFAGSLAEFVSAPLDQVCHMPDNLSFEDAAAIPLVW
jgi:hypothetical protein